MAIGRDGRMSEAAGDLDGLDAGRGRRRVIAWAGGARLVEKREPYRHSVGTCERCHSRIEPLISLQWWCAMRELARPGDRGAAASVASASIPSRSTASRSTSLEEAPDWCVSRQLWWGHQIPIWYCPDGHTTCRVADARARVPSAARPSSTRESDVLDTWFSSALWPFATLGWPDDTPELARYYPGNVNSTAREIIRLWENRMICPGLEAARRHPVHRRDHPLDRARRRRPAHVEEPRHRHRPDGADPRSTAPTRRATGC